MEAEEPEVRSPDLEAPLLRDAGAQGQDAACEGGV